jgi:hypothetical protein
MSTLSATGFSKWCCNPSKAGYNSGIYRGIIVGKKTGKTKQTAFRLSDEEVELLDSIAEHLTKERSVTHSRTDAIRAAARAIAQMLGILPKPKKK